MKPAKSFRNFAFVRRVPSALAGFRLRVARRRKVAAYLEVTRTADSLLEMGDLMVENASSLAAARVVDRDDCQRCGMFLTLEGFCANGACVYSDCMQDVPAAASYHRHDGDFRRVFDRYCRVDEDVTPKSRFRRTIKQILG